MTTVLIVIHLMVVLALIALVLLQRSEGGALGMGGGGGGGGMMSGRGVGNLLTRTTGILAVAFFATSIGLTIIARLESNSGILDNLPGSDSAIQTPVQQPSGGQIQTPPSAGGSVLEGLREQSGLESTPPTPPASGDNQ